jgi:hypothetical protein
MDLGTAGTGIGAGLSIAGGIYSAVTGSRDQAQIAAQERAIAMDEIQMNQVRRTAMEVTSRRQQTQNLRSQQMARSMALNTATNQGAQFGSGLQGAYGSISGQSNVNAQSISQNLQLGEKMFDLSDQETASKMYLAQDQAAAASDAAMGKLIGGLGSSLGDLGKLGSSIGGLFNT